MTLSPLSTSSQDIVTDLDQSHRFNPFGRGRIELDETGLSTKLDSLDPEHPTVLALSSLDPSQFAELCPKLDDGAARAYLWNKYPDFAKKWDSGDGFFGKPGDGILQGAEFSKPGGSEALIADIKAMMPNPYDRTLLFSRDLFSGGFAASGVNGIIRAGLEDAAAAPDVDIKDFAQLTGFDVSDVGSVPGKVDLGDDVYRQIGSGQIERVEGREVLKYMRSTERTLSGASVKEPMDRVRAQIARISNAPKQPGSFADQATSVAVHSYMSQLLRVGLESTVQTGAVLSAMMESQTNLLWTGQADVGALGNDGLDDALYKISAVVALTQKAALRSNQEQLDTPSKHPMLQLRGTDSMVQPLSHAVTDLAAQLNRTLDGADRTTTARQVRRAALDVAQATVEFTLPRGNTLPTDCATASKKLLALAADASASVAGDASEAECRAVMEKMATQAKAIMAGLQR